MRGYAAVSVLAFHACALSWDTIATGMAPVVVFFVLSGFLLARSLDRDSDPFAFVRHRLFRLLPAAVTTVLLLTLAYQSVGFYMGLMPPSFDPLNIVLNALLIRSDINGVMWSLTVECVAIPVILMSHALLRRHGTIPVWTLVAILVALSFWGPYVHVLDGATNLAPLYAFVVGLLLQSGGALPGDSSQSMLQPSRATVVGSAAFAVMVIVAVRKQTAVTIAFETLCASALVYLAAFGSRKLAVLGPFDFGIVRFYGRISYSFYLLHMIGLAIAARLLPFDQQPVVRAAILFVAALLITTPAAWLMWRFVEMPFIDLGRRRLVAKAADVVGRL
ncbi:acyltransferase family protein [Bradyrhizobium sp. GCM10027634]|uniref:acyltransferase family protein n=1 Tax=unclassified Bradyrhizobium TaxID=2631580 RepID=UPI00188AF996|nr:MULTISPECIES: acyltransferase [unclassified Bradyrhizobium]MDN5001880.1 acyltransferase [Bradyrhizobium sp. WYCCWR 12677]